MKLFFNFISFLLFVGHFSFAQSNETITSSDEPQFPGGTKAMMKFLVDNLQYPEDAIDKGIEGKVMIKFKVDPKGKVQSVKIEQGMSNCPKCNLEAIRVVESMPNWVPAKNSSNDTYMVLPINFVLEGEGEDDEETLKKRLDGHWAGFDIGTLILLDQNLNSNFDENPYWKNAVNQSISLNLNLFEYKIPLIKQYLGITTGFGLGISTIGFKDNYLIQHNADTVFAVKDPNQNYRTNNLSATYLTAPLLLEFSSKAKQKKSLYVNAGLIGGIRIGSSTNKTGKFENGDRFQMVVRSKYNLAPFTLDATVRAGYGILGFYASYQMNSLFKQGKTVGVYPFKLGITLNVDYLEKKKTKE